MSGGKIANTMPATGADRTTGATDEQIDAAIQHWFASFGDKLSRIQTEGARDQRDAFRFAAEHLVPPGYAIVPESERMSPVLKAAIGRVMTVMKQLRAYRDCPDEMNKEKLWDLARADYALTESDLALLRHAAEGGTT